MADEGCRCDELRGVGGAVGSGVVNRCWHTSVRGKRHQPCHWVAGRSRSSGLAHGGDGVSDPGGVALTHVRRVRRSERRAGRRNGALYGYRMRPGRRIVMAFDAIQVCLERGPQRVLPGAFLRCCQGPGTSGACNTTTSGELRSVCGSGLIVLEFDSDSVGDGLIPPGSDARCPMWVCLRHDPYDVGGHGRHSV